MKCPVKLRLIGNGLFQGTTCVMVCGGELDALETPEEIDDFGANLFALFSSVKAQVPRLVVQDVPAKAEAFVVLCATLGKFGVQVLLNIYDNVIPMITLPNVMIQAYCHMHTWDPSLDVQEGRNLVSVCMFLENMPVNIPPNIPNSVALFLIPSTINISKKIDVLELFKTLDRKFIYQESL